MIDIKKMSIAKRTAYLSVFCAVAIIFSYVEVLIHVSIIPIAGFKLGLANIAVLVTLIVFGLRAGLLVSIAKTIVVSLLFSGVTSMMFSLSGGLLSVIFMWLILKAGDKFSIYGVSVIGATMHNIGQLAIAVPMAGSFAVLAYLPFLMISSIITGLAIGIISSIIIRVIDSKNLCT